MKRLFLAVLLSAFAVGSAMAQETCESKAVGKNGKPLAGAAKTSFMQKCKRAVEVAAVSGGDAAFGIVLFCLKISLGPSSESHSVSSAKATHRIALPRSLRRIGAYRPLAALELAECNEL